MTQNAINNSASDLTVDNLFLDGNTISSTDTNGNIILAPDGSGEVSVTAAPIVPSTDRADSLGSATNSWDNVYADGLTFDDGTNVLSTFLDITSFTPSLTFGGASVGMTYSTQKGFYVRIGNAIFFTILIVLTNKGSSTGNAEINLPVSTTSGANVISIFSNVNLTGGRTNVYGAVGVPAPTSMGLYQMGPGLIIQPITNVNINNNSLISFSSLYFAT